MVYRLGPIWERWLGWPITTRHGEMIAPLTVEELVAAIKKSKGGAL
jgi:hypothetical protein